MTNDAIKMCFILGTRPEIIKLYSVLNAAQEHEEVVPVIIHTGQHYDYEMSQVFLEELELPEFQHFLNIKSGSHAEMTSSLLVELERTLLEESPDAVIVLGDTNTTMAGALAAVKLNIPAVHVEAGCRSFDIAMPEEVNRLVTDSISSVYFAPSESAALNLLYEGRQSDRVFQAGNTVVDIVEETQELRKQMDLSSIGVKEFDVAVTLHRQENVDDKDRLAALLKALEGIKGTIVFPIHPRTKKRIEEFELADNLHKASNIHIIKPLNYLSFMKLLEDAKVIITDSGGVQEEAVMVGTPCITARDTTEWPETVWCGGNTLAGMNDKKITDLCNRLIEEHDKPKNFSNPFKGNAGKTIIEILVDLWKKDTLNIPKPDMSDGKYPLPWLLELKTLKSEPTTSSLVFDKNGKAITDKEKDGKFLVGRKSN
ncbi:MAG: non-hydrolyzing UDP-N-acetylglucosamine 2-epimerase [Candidatus Thorarchaeota archaeon]